MLGKYCGTHNSHANYTTQIKDYRVDENIIATIKMRNNFCYPLKMVIAPHLVVALNLFASIFV